MAGCARTIGVLTPRCSDDDDDDDDNIDDYLSSRYLYTRQYNDTVMRIWTRIRVSTYL